MEECVTRPPKFSPFLSRVAPVLVERQGNLDDTQLRRVHTAFLSTFTNNFCSHEWTSGFLTNDTFHPSSIG